MASITKVMRTSVANFFAASNAISLLFTSDLPAVGRSERGEEASHDKRPRQIQIYYNERAYPRDCLLFFALTAAVCFCIPGPFT